MHDHGLLPLSSALCCTLRNAVLDLTLLCFTLPYSVAPSLTLLHSVGIQPCSLQPNAEGQVELDFWGHADDGSALEVRNSIRPYLQAMGDSILFTPQ